MHITHIRRIVSTLAAFALGALTLGQANAQEAPSSQSEEIARLQQEISQLTQRLQTLEQKAMTTPAAVESRADYNARLKKVAVESQPEAKPLIERQEELVEKLAGSSDIGKAPDQRSEKFQTRFQEYEAVNRQIQPVMQKAAQTPEVQEKFKAYREALIAEMTKLEADAPRLLARHQELNARYQSLLQAAN
ncbi:MAG: hypothetical protein ABII82_04495 [Verrucomicrobiota bacterium]